MKPEIIKQVIDEIRDHVKDNSFSGGEFVKFSDSRYSAYHITKDNFKEITEGTEGSSKKIAFID